MKGGGGRDEMHEKARPGWKLRAAGDYVDRRKNKLRIRLSTRCCTARRLPHLPASPRHGLP